MPQRIRTAMGLRLRAARLAAKMTQQDVARDFLCSRQSVSSWESGRTMPSVLELRELLVLYGVSADEIFFGESDVRAATKDAMYRFMSKPDFAESEAPD